MRLRIVTTAQFRRDYKRIKKRGYDLSLLEGVLDRLCAGQPLSASCRDHALAGSYKGFRECHVQPDWLLVYAIDGKRLILTASRTGAHSDLFDE